MNSQNDQQNQNQQPQYQQPQYQQPQYQQPQYQQPQYQQPQYQQTQYQQPQFPQKPPRNPNDGLGMSIASLVVGCCGILFCWVGILNFIILACGIVSVIMGNMGRKKSIMAYGKASALATAGFILGIVGTAISGIGAISCLACLSCSSCSACSAAGALENAFEGLYSFIK